MAPGIRPSSLIYESLGKAAEGVDVVFCQIRIICMRFTGYVMTVVRTARFYPYYCLI